VEGQGETTAVPVLLRRLAAESRAYQVTVGKPIRRNRSQLTQEDALRRAVRLALLQPGCSAILIVLDGDDDCPKELAPRVEGWATEEAGQVPCRVVVAMREYESWFLGAVESLRGHRGVRLDADPPPDPEAPRGAKEALEQLMVVGRTYSATADQARLTALFDMQLAYKRCRSFRRMTKAFAGLVGSAGTPLVDWPPSGWNEG
jgi:hypothetical protein